MLKTARKTLALLKKGCDFAAQKPPLEWDGGRIYPESVHRLGGNAVAVAGGATGDFLLVISDCAKFAPEGFAGEELALEDGGSVVRCAADAVNAAALRRHFPWVSPSNFGGVSGNVRRCGGAGFTPADEAKLFLPEAGLPEKVQLEAFKQNFHGRYGVLSRKVNSLEACDAALRAGFTVISLELSRGEGGSEVESDYAGRTFVLGEAVKVEFSSRAAECAGMRQTVNFLAAAAERARRAGAGVLLNGDFGLCEWLFVLREANKLGLELVAAVGAPGAEFAALCRGYGNCRFAGDGEALLRM